MRQNQLVRFIAGLVGVVAGFSGPTLALSHGMAHARYAAAEHRAERRAVQMAPETERAAEQSGVVESADGAGDYFEAIHCQQCAERTGVVKLALPVPPEMAVAFVRNVVAVATGIRTQVLESASEFLPDQPRAPPRLS